MTDDTYPIGHSVKRILAEKFKPIEQVCGPLSSASVGIIAGEPGVGKSLWVLDMCAHIAAGQDFESWRVPKPLAVLYIDGEMPGSFIQERLLNMPASDNLWMVYEDWLQAHGEPQIDLGLQAHQDRFLSPLYQSTFDIFVFDTTFSVLSAPPGSDMWRPEYWSQVQGFNRKMRAAGKVVIYVDHTNRQGQTQGTSAKKQGIEFEWLLEHWARVGETGASFHLEVGKDRTPPKINAKSSWIHGANYGWKIMT